MEDSCTNGKQWFALYTKPRHEFKAALQLESILIEHYLPTLTRVKKWSDRKKKVTEPLFRGYIFIHADDKERYHAIAQKAIVRCISFNGKPSVIPAWQIENLKIMLTQSPDVFVSAKIEVGTKVKIIEGPFKDAIGVVNCEQEEKWFAVSVELIHRSIMVRLPIESVVKFLEN
ncbi:MAG: UpxY family transcription antiterminator [Bacteroidota bacterium]